MFPGDHRGSPNFKSPTRPLPSISSIITAMAHALWLNSPPARKFYVEENQTFYFVRPTSAPGLARPEPRQGPRLVISQRIHEAYANVAPAKVLANQPNRSLSNRPAKASTRRSLTLQTPELAAVQH